MIQIALAKDWKLENIEPYGDEDFINEANRQIADLILKKNQIKNSNVEIKRVKSPLQQQKVNLQNEDLNPKIICELIINFVSTIIYLHKLIFIK
ncbi:hypothetical protein [Aliarcobacter cibarius]|uniref:hypothetical protein n=1 Tax=Aliarcobacter cibarius TaxID=255507 RepID=UPI001D189CC8|nr:hypothetical protein [Aliarcobacter cibarius]